MPRYNVESDGEYACFSSISDSFITSFMPISEYEEWRTIQYGKQKTSIENANKMTLKEALLTLCLNKRDEEIGANVKFLFSRDLEDGE